MAVLGMLFVFGTVLLIGDYRKSSQSVDRELIRNGYGEGKKTETFRVQNSQGEVGDLQVEVSEQVYAASDMERVFQRVLKTMDTLILGENQSLDHIDSDMQLITEIPGEPIDVSWELDHYDVMNVYGALKKDKLTENGTSVKIQAMLTYRENRELQAAYECMAVVYPQKKSGKEGFLAALTSEIEKKDEDTRGRETLTLPKTVDGEEVTYYRPWNTRGMVVMIASVLVMVLLFALDRQREEEQEQKKKQQMILDYPEIISKLTLLLGAGMNVKRAWRRIVEDYNHGKKDAQERDAYEEMAYTYHEMEGGVSEAESYERFGRRCGSQEYLRLGALLSQNLRKGTKGLKDLLNLEAIQAFEERKAHARKAGEEAGTKLLVPIFLMLAEVLIVVVVPAFFSVKL